jgi:hypothetical protein
MQIAAVERGGLLELALVENPHRVRLKLQNAVDTNPGLSSWLDCGIAPRQK